MTASDALDDDSWRVRDAISRQFRSDLPNDRSGDERWGGRHLSPALVAEVLSSTELESPRAEAAVRSVYNQAWQAGALSFDELVGRKVLRVSCGEVHWSRGLRRAVEVRDDLTCRALRPLMALPYGPTVRLAANALCHLETSSSPEALALAHSTAPQKILDALRTFVSRALAPGWVAARLWELGRRRPDSVWWWYARDVLLDNACAAPDPHWSPGLAESLADALVDAIEREADLVGWEDERSRIIAARASDGGLGVPDELDGWAPVPQGFFGRLEWIREMEAHCQDALTDARESMLALVGIAMRAIEHAPNRSVPHPQMARLLQLASERPALITGIRWALRQQPREIADMLFERESAAWAIDCLSRWRVDRGAFDGDENRQERRILGCLESAMGAAVRTWAQDPAASGDSFGWVIKRLHQRDDETCVGSHCLPREAAAVLWKAVAYHESGSAGWRETLFVAAVESLTAQSLAEGTAGPWFGAALELLRENGFYLSARQRVSAHQALQAAYLASLRRDHVLEPQPLRPALAREFVRGMLDGEGGNALVPTIPELRALLRVSEGNYAGIHAARTRLRTHIRLVARAITGWGADKVDACVVDWFADALALATARRPENGLIDAFAACDERREGAPATALAWDVAQAVKHLPTDQRKKIVETIARIDEPMAIANILRELQGRMRGRLTDAVQAAAPIAPSVDSLSDIWARIWSLLDAELYDEAEAALKEEASLSPWGRVARRPRWQFVAQLRLDLGKKRYDQVLKACVPADLAGGGDDDPQYVLDFYQALADLERPDGRENAVRRFAALQRRFPNVRAYAENLHSARIRRLLSPDERWPVAAERLDAVAALFAEGEALMSRFRKHGSRPDAVYEGNRAILLMAMGENERVVADLGADEALLWSSDRLVAFRARAFHRLGRNADAAALVARAVDEFGETDDLREARSELEGGTSPLRLAEQRRLLGPADIRHALGDLLLCEPAEQALAVSKDSVHQMITDLLVANCRTVARLVPILALKGGADGVPWEEGINLLLARLLERAVQHLGWAVNPEDPDGFTKGPKWGSRDLTLGKDGQSLALAEAQRVKAASGFERDVRAHIQQIMRKSTDCNLAVHILWSFAPDPRKVLEKVREVVANMIREAGSPEIESAPSRINPGPFGFVSAFRAGSLIVVHLVVDMQQQAQRDGSV